MNIAVKTTKKERVLFNNPEATKLYREAITEFIALKPWEVNATDNTLTICNTFRYKVNKRCYLGYEFWNYNRDKNSWVRCKKGGNQYNPLLEVNYFSYGSHTSFKSIFINVATEFIRFKKKVNSNRLSSEQLDIAERLFMSYCKGCYKNHSYSNYKIVEWFKKTSEIDFKHIVKIGFKVGYYSAKHLQTLKIVDFLSNENLDCNAAERYLVNNPDFTGLYVYLDPIDREKIISKDLLSDGITLIFKENEHWQLKIPKKSFNRFRNVGTSLITHYFETIRIILNYATETRLAYGAIIDEQASLVNRYKEHIGLEILLYLSGLHLELGLKKPNYRFINRILSKTIRHVFFRGNDWQSCKYNIKIIYHAFYKLMYINKDTKERNAYIGKNSESNQLTSDIDMIFDYMDQIKEHRFDKRSSINGIKIRVQNWIDENNKIKLENQKQTLIARSWLARILSEPVMHKNYQFTEILNFYDLYLEGSKMSHCVYHNFKHSVEDGSVLVFHVQHNDDPDDQATLGLEVINQDYVVFQNYGYRNNVPSDGIKKATRAFLKQVNQD